MLSRSVLLFVDLRWKVDKTLKKAQNKFISSLSWKKSVSFFLEAGWESLEQ